MPDKKIRFDVFLNRYLYGDEGYYSSLANMPLFDYKTAPQHSPAFCKFIALTVENFVKELSLSEFIVVDLGAGFGELSAAFAEKFPDKEIYALEISKKRRQWIKEKYSYLKNLKAVGSLQKIKPKAFTFFTANEFFDSLPVRVFKKENDGFLELYHDQSSKNFVFLKARKNSLPAAVRHFKKDIPDGWIFEYESALSKFFQLLKNHKNALLLVIDYGFMLEEIERFPGGTIIGFKNHLYLNDPLKILLSGEKVDLTHYVNFSWLIFEAEKAGFKTLLYSSYGKFVSNRLLKVASYLSKNELRENLLISMPHRFGDSFKVLLLKK